MLRSAAARRSPRSWGNPHVTVLAAAPDAVPYIAGATAVGAAILQGYGFTVYVGGFTCFDWNKRKPRTLSRFFRERTVALGFQMTG